MLTAQRRALILESLASGGRTVVQLAGELLVSESTIRRDLDALALDGKLERKYGGAILTSGSRATITDSGREEGSLAQERDRDYDLRVRVAEAAASLVEDGDIIVLDIGLTTPLVARALHGRRITIITANLEVLDEVRADDAIDVVLLGGALRRNYQTLVGSLTEQAVAHLNADIMFLSCTGVRDEHVLDNMAVEAPIKQALIGASARTVLLAHERKFPGTGAMRICTLEDVDTLITTEGNTSEELLRRRESGRKVIVA